MTEKTAVDDPATPDELSDPTGVSSPDDATGFTPAHAPHRRVEYERCVDADGWVDPVAERTGQPPATDAASALSAYPNGDTDA